MSNGQALDTLVESLAVAKPVQIYCLNFHHRPVHAHSDDVLVKHNRAIPSNLHGDIPYGAFVSRKLDQLACAMDGAFTDVHRGQDLLWWSVHIAVHSQEPPPYIGQDVLMWCLAARKLIPCSKSSFAADNTAIA